MVQNTPPLLVDVAHNPAMQYLLEYLKRGNHRVIWVLSWLSDKDSQGMLDCLQRYSNLLQAVVLVGALEPRSMTLMQLRRLFEKYSWSCPLIPLHSTADAVMQAQYHYNEGVAKKDGATIIVASGCFELVAQVRQYVLKGAL